MKDKEQILLEEMYVQIHSGIKTIDVSFDLLDESIKEFVLASLKKAVPYVVAAGLASGLGSTANAQDQDGMFNVSSKRLYSSLTKQGFVKQQEHNLKKDIPPPFDSQYATMTKKDHLDLGHKIQLLHNVYIEVIREKEIQTGFITATVEIEGEVFAMTQEHANTIASKLVKELLEKNNMTVRDLNLIQEETLRPFPFKIRANIIIPKKNI